MHRAALALGLVLVVGGCVAQPALLDVPLETITVRPSGGSDARTPAVPYVVGRTAFVSAFLEDGAGKRFPLRADVLRPPGAYALALDGTAAMDGVGAVRRAALADGRYTLRLVARDAAGASVERTVQVQVSGADTQPPKLGDVAVSPAVISPYDPAYAVETVVSYRLAEPAEVALAVIALSGQRTPIAPPVAAEPGEHRIRWDGTVGYRYPRDGAYMIEVAARDSAGNEVVATRPVRLVGMTPPDARITAVGFSPERLATGDALRVEVSVRNVGLVTLYTHGPAPGFTYASRETFGSVDGGRHAEQRNTWRVGVDWEAGPIIQSARYPYRWGLGRDLAPGEETTIVGYVRLAEPYRSLRVFAGLIREGAAHHIDRAGAQVIELVQ